MIMRKRLVHSYLESFTTFNFDHTFFTIFLAVVEILCCFAALHLQYFAKICLGISLSFQAYVCVQIS
jgi:hypothetical protein